MERFRNIYKRDMTNAKHFAFIEAFVAALEAKNFTAQKIVAALEIMRARFAVEKQWYMRVRASETIAQRKAANKRRNRYYARLHHLVKAWKGSEMQLLDEAASEIIKVFQLYRLNVNSQLDEETGHLDNLIGDLSTDEMQAHIATLSGTFLYQQMAEANELVKSLRLEEGVEVSEKVPGALASARKDCDAAYDNLCTLIEAAALLADDTAPYEQFIREWNGTIKIYQEVLDG